MSIYMYTGIFRITHTADPKNLRITSKCKGQTGSTFLALDHLHFLDNQFMSCKVKRRVQIPGLTNLWHRSKIYCERNFSGQLDQKRGDVQPPGGRIIFPFRLKSPMGGCVLQCSTTLIPIAFSRNNLSLSIQKLSAWPQINGQHISWIFRDTLSRPCSFPIHLITKCQSLLETPLSSSFRRSHRF